MQRGGDATKRIARQVADHYSARPNQTRQQRENSPIIHLKKLNNWVKSVLIHLYAQPKDAVLDLACGKGGDLMKWDKAGIGYYVGVDIARGSIEDARLRYNGETEHNRSGKRKDFSFSATLVCADCFEVDLDGALRDCAPFDLCSCQFALHYSWSTETRAFRAIANVSRLLQPGGYFIGTMPDANVLVRKLREADGLEFGNSVYKVKFDDRYAEKRFKGSEPFGLEYGFFLEDAVDCPEWLVHFPKLISLAEQNGLELVLHKNFHDFTHEYCQQPEFADLMRKFALGDGIAAGIGSSISDDEWDAAYLYTVFVFRKIDPEAEGNEPRLNRPRLGTSTSTSGKKRNKHQGPFNPIVENDIICIG